MPDRPAISQSLYRLSYPAHLVLNCPVLYLWLHLMFLRITKRNGTRITVRLFSLFALYSISRCHICVFFTSNFSWLSFFFFHGWTAQLGLGLLCEVPWSHSFIHTTLGRTPLDEWSAPGRDLYLTTHNTQKRQTSMSLEAFEPTNQPRERRQTHALDRTTTGIDHLGVCKLSFPHRTVFGSFLT